jgi:large subunit ribosomal protein L7Ae
MPKKQTKKVEAKPVAVADPLFPSTPRSFRVGGDVRPKGRDLSRFVKWPRYIRLQRQRKILYQRLKVPPAINQFKKTLNRNEAAELFKLLEPYRPESKTEKAERRQAMAEAKAKGEGDGKSKKKMLVKYGLKHVTHLVEQKKAKLVAIAHDVDPIELVVWLPALCKKMDVPYCIVKSKSRLGAFVHNKTATVLAVTEVKKEDQHKLSSLASSFTSSFNDDVQTTRKWGGGIMGRKTQEKLLKREKALEAEQAKLSQY